MGIVSLLQISTLNTLLILPVLLLGHQLSANLLWIIVVAIAVFNVFILNRYPATKRSLTHHTYRI
jgi:hypothetical protein